MNCCYVLYYHKMRKERKSYVITKYLREIMFSIYCLYKYSGIDPRITFFVSSKSASLFDDFCNQLFDNKLIHQRSSIGFSPVPWGTKTLAWCAAMTEFDSFLFLDTDVKFIKELPVNMFSNKSMLFCPGNPKHINKTRKLVKKYFKTKIGKNVGLPVTWFNRHGEPDVDYVKLRDNLNKTLATIEKAMKRKEAGKGYCGAGKGVDDQMVMSITLKKMGISPKQVTSNPDLFSSRDSVYYAHDHNLFTPHCDVNDAIRWFCDKGVDVSRYLMDDVKKR